MKFGEKIEQYFSFQASTKSVIPQVTKTQLEIAAGKGDLTQVKSLVDHADFKEEDGENALYMAAYCGKLEIVQYLLTKNIDIKIQRYSDDLGNKRSGIFENCYQLIYKKWLAREAQKIKEITKKKSMQNDDTQNATVYFENFGSQHSEYSYLHECEVEKESTDIEDVVNINELDAHGDTFLHKAVKAKNGYLISELIYNGADVFLENKVGLSSLELAIQLNFQDQFNLLINLMDKTTSINRVQINRYASCDKILTYVSGYFESYPNENKIQTINFFWNYFGKPFCNRASGEDKMKMIYFFKGLYIKGSVKLSKNDCSQTKEIALAQQLKQLVILYNERSMIHLNTCRHWYSISWGADTRKSALQDKLERIVINVKNILGGEISDLAQRCDQLSYKFNEQPKFYKQLNDLVYALDKLTDDRGLEYGASPYINHALGESSKLLRV